MEFIIVATKQASKFLSNRKNLGPTGKHSVRFGDIVKGELDAGPSVWNGERWVPSSPHILIHSPQITSKDEAKSLVSSLQSDGKYETVIIGCDPGKTLYNLEYMLEKAFGRSSAYIVHPSLDENYAEFDSLRDRIRYRLNLPAVEEADVKTDETDGIVGAGKGNPQEEARHLRVTLTNTSGDVSTPTVINVHYNEGDHLELDFRNTNQETK